MLVTLFASLPLRHRLTALAESWQRLLQMASDPYRPELHYMRGPGPACRAKQREQNGLQSFSLAGKAHLEGAVRDNAAAPFSFR